MSKPIKCPRCNIKMVKIPNDTNIRYNIPIYFWEENVMGVYHCKKCSSRQLDNGRFYAFFTNGQIYQFNYGNWELINTEKLKKEKGKYVGGFKIIQ